MGFLGEFVISQFWIHQWINAILELGQFFEVKYLERGPLLEEITLCTLLKTTSHPQSLSLLVGHSSVSHLFWCGTSGSRQWIHLSEASETLPYFNSNLQVFFFPHGEIKICLITIYVLNSNPFFIYLLHPSFLILPEDLVYTSNCL